MNCRTVQQYIQLDLDGELPPACRTVLEVHLASCIGCRERRRQLAIVQVAMHRWAGSKEPDAPPIDFGHPRSAGWRTGMAAAAAIALLVGGYLAISPMPRSSKTPAPPVIAQARPENLPTAAQLDPRASVRVTFPAEDDLIIVPTKTQNPNVTIIWVYPTLRTAQAPAEPLTGPPPSS